MDSIAIIEQDRIEASAKLDRRQRCALGQFMTPATIAHYMASLFSLSDEMRLLDPGAGIGSLTAAFLDRMAHEKKAKVSIEVWEIDAILRGYLNQTLARYRNKTPDRIDTVIHSSDFIEEASFFSTIGYSEPFTHAILNPPYKKLSSQSAHRKYLRHAGIETVNLYAGFVALAINLLADKGELVAIIPRSFCNGTYYRPFRKILIESCSIKSIHLFESRRTAFKDDNVLQESIIIHIVKGGVQRKVDVTTSVGPDFTDLKKITLAFSRIVQTTDHDQFIRIPTSESDIHAPMMCTDSLEEIGIGVCTGPVVDFRLKEHWCREPADRSSVVPLLYPHHFADRVLIWPKKHKKPNALMRNDATEKWLMPNGEYVIVKRFSSKEERRRVVAYHVKKNDLAAEMIGFENHWNVFHFAKGGIDENLARGLCIFLNSTALDQHFRVFSGHTQVNATDLRSMKYPSREKLILLGKSVESVPRDQAEIDMLVGQL